ncbi:MAG: hypothetical protein O2809_04110 [Proteobacteria bacterium]|nr:hypothetical protein [Pseudomonadota bacterium]
MTYEALHQSVNYTPKDIDKVTVVHAYKSQPKVNDIELSDSTKIAIGAVRASGGDVTENDLILASKIDSGEITTEQAIKMVISQYVD